MTGQAVACAAACVLALASTGCGSGTVSRGAPAAEPAGGLLVAAASDLRFAFEELGSEYERRTGTKVTFVFGSSGQLARQIVEGAPYDVFASANASFVDEVIDAGRGDAATETVYAFGRIVVWARDRELSLVDLADPALRAIAIANPEHAPYGVAAREALEAAGLLSGVRDRLVLGENISDAHRLAASGNADAAISALALALAPTERGRWTLVPAELHAPLEQTLVVTARGSGAASARDFAAFVGSPEGRETMRGYGFLLPGDPPPEE